jgi:HD-GYP domain-containing protein (c-di-GMP phosphodiesterase class II)
VSITHAPSEFEFVLPPTLQGTSSQHSNLSLGLSAELPTDQPHSIDLAQLKAGFPLKFDLIVQDGTTLATAGSVVTAEHKSEWFRQGHRIAVLAKPTQPSAINSSQRQPTQPLYDKAILDRLEISIQRSADLVVKTATQLVQGTSPSLVGSLNLIEELQSDILKDTASVLAGFAGSLNEEASENDLALAQRNSRMSILGLILAIRLDFSAQDQQTTALVGMYHDLSLLDSVRNSGLRKARCLFSHHSLNSAALLESVPSLNPKVPLAVSQVHEQVDGTGYPRRLAPSRILPIARILNVVDAYLTLTTSGQPNLFPLGRNFHPADALGYLMYHAALERFDKSVVRALVDVGSLYPIGCRVKLSDGYMATVIRSNQQAPSLPIVQRESEERAVIDLNKSNMRITGPAQSSGDLCRRIRKSNLPKIYWRTE